MGAKPYIASAVAVLLVVGVVIGVVVISEKTNGSDKENEKSNLLSSKYATDFCAPASYKDACLKSVEPVATNSTATPKDYMMTIIQATIEEVKKAMNVTKGMSIDQKTDPLHHLVVEDCKELLEYAIEELQASMSMVGDSELHNLNDRVDELLNWLAAVYTYQTTCIDDFKNPEYKSTIENGMVNSTQLTHNAIDIVASTSEVLKAFNINLQSNNKSNSNGSRRLLEVYEMGHDDYPTWFKAGDRRLLAKQQAGTLKPNAIVGKGGSFKTISEAIAAYDPSNFKGKRYIIHVKAGVYKEKVTVEKHKLNVFIYGDGAGKTIVTGDRNVKIMNLSTPETATFNALGDDFMAKGMTFRNTAGPKGEQAVALRVVSDRAAFFQCNLEGYQDTLYYHCHRQFYRNCKIEGTIDFIFGEGTVVIQNSEIIVRKGDPRQYNVVTADGKQVKNEITGLVLQNCKIKAGPDLFPRRFEIKSYLGRPWKGLSKLVVMESEIGDFIDPEGYTPWVKNGTANGNEKTAEYYEFANTGAGAKTNKRNKLFLKSGVISKGEAAKYTAGNFINGNLWLPAIDRKVQLGFTK